jgi:hypothetical protein
VIALLGLSGGIWLASTGKSLIGLGTVFLALASVVSSFISKRQSQTASRAAKRAKMDERK